MLTLHRLPRPYRVLYVGIAVLLAVALLSHWWRLSLRHGAMPAAVAAWYQGDQAAMLFRKAAVEVAEDAWMNLFHHTLAFLVLGGLLMRTGAAPRTKAGVGASFGAGTIVTAVGPPLVWWGMPGAATGYVAALALLSAIGLLVLGLVARDAVVRRSSGHRGVPGSDVLAVPKGLPGGRGRAVRRSGGQAVVFTAVLLTTGSPDRLSATVRESFRAQAGVYLTEREAIREVFPAAQSVATDTIRPDSAARAALEESLGRPLLEREFVFRLVYGEAAASGEQRATRNPKGLPDGRAQRLVGYALVTEERGKYRPITMLIGVDTAGRVAGVRILVYREPRGGEVARQFFLRQYRGKRVGDPVRLNRDVINISGATISVQSVNTAVRKTLALVQRYYPDPEPTAPRSLLQLSEVP